MSEPANGPRVDDGTPTLVVGLSSPVVIVFLALMAGLLVIVGALGYMAGRQASTASIQGTPRAAAGDEPAAEAAPPPASLAPALPGVSPHLMPPPDGRWGMNHHPCCPMCEQFGKGDGSWLMEERWMWGYPETPLRSHGKEGGGSHSDSGTETNDDGGYLVPPWLVPSPLRPDAMSLPNEHGMPWPGDGTWADGFGPGTSGMLP